MSDAKVETANVWNVLILDGQMRKLRKKGKGVALTFYSQNPTKILRVHPSKAKTKTH